MRHGVRWRQLFFVGALVFIAAMVYMYFDGKDSPKSYVSRAAVSRMTALLEYTQSACEQSQEALPEDIKAEDWYAPYVKIALQEGYFAAENNKFYPMKLVTFGEAAYIAAKLDVDVSKLKFDISGQDKEDLIESDMWNEIYEAAAAGINGLEIKEVTVTKTSAETPGLTAWHCMTDGGELYFPGFALDKLKGCRVRIAVRGDVAAAVLGETDTASDGGALQSSEAASLKGDTPSKEDGGKNNDAPETLAGEEGGSTDAMNVRVILNRDDFSGVIHDSVRLVSDKPITLATETFEAGEEILLSPGDDYFKNGGSVLAKTDGGRIQILSLNRSHGHPSYRGSLKISSVDNGLTIVNELLAEEYLYGVLPSEMPVSGGLEALKVQAVCARSFVYKSVNEGTAYNDYGADVDDSTSSQVYNNAPEDDTACAAVDATRGELLYSGSEPVKAYFFSTSCGVTSDAEDVWLTSSDIPYLSAGLQDAVISKDGAQTVAVPNEAVPDLSDEAAFRAFIDNTDDRDYYEKDSSMFRWYVHLDAADIKTSVAAPKNLTVSARGSSGVAKTLTVTGNDGVSVEISGEYNIRKALSVAGKTIECADGMKVTNQTMLPSGYFYVNSTENGFDIYGGGFGHGVGMSQSGVAKMTERGMNYETILAHYFRGTTIKKAY